MYDRETLRKVDVDGGFKMNVLQCDNESIINDRHDKYGAI
jgi:hypothetical protein